MVSLSTNKKAAVQAHSSVQVERRVDKHREKNLSCQTNPQTHTVFCEELTLKHISQGVKV